MKDETVPLIFIEDKVHLSRDLEVNGIQCSTIDCKKDEKLHKCAEGENFLNNISSYFYQEESGKLILIFKFIFEKTSKIENNLASF